MPPAHLPHSGAPVLLACSHGTRSLTGATAVASLVDAVRRARPGLDVRLAHVDVQEPTPADAVGDLGGAPVVLVPLLLTAGHHVRVDLAHAAQSAPAGSAAVAAALAPDDRIVEVLADRVTTALGAPPRPHDVVVVASAGSSDPDAVADCERVTVALAARLGVRGHAAYLSAAQPDLPTAVATARKQASGRGRVILALHLLAPGHFATLAATTDADAVTTPLLAENEPPPTALVELVLARYDEAARARTQPVPVRANSSRGRHTPSSSSS